MKKCFTLVEILISVIIMWILFGIIFATYNQIWNLAIKIENERNLSSEILFVSQNLQNLADKLKINYSKHDNLDSTDWFTGSLYFTWQNDVQIYLTWDSVSDTKEIKDNNSWIEMQKDWTTIKLTDPNKVFVKNLYFKIIPYKDWQVDRWMDYDDIYNYWFWIFMDTYNSRYNRHRWPFDVKSADQTFYNIRQY